MRNYWNRERGIMNYPDDHLCQEVRNALMKLSDAVCMWERSTNRQSVLIFREHGGFNYRAQSGKPGIPDDVTDQQLLLGLELSDPTKE